MQGQLFTQEFLTPGVFDTPAFQALSDSRFGVFKAALKGIFSGFSAASNPNEAQTENDIINKVLLALGWGGDTLPQVKLSGKPAAQFVALIAKLYAVESHAQDNNLSAPERLRYRQQHSVAVLADIQTLLLAHLHSVVPGSAL
ncbi:MAG: transposase, partial [Betaproteobacteria bacterium]